MLANEHVVITGEKVVLVPYRKEHVEIYHGWMQDAELQELTASEPLTIDQEYQMQQDWKHDERKCTFIVLDRELADSDGTGHHGGAMAGDVNLYWNDHDDDHAAEIEVMIAAKESRRKGLALEALQLFMAYAIGQLSVNRFCAKIGFDNVPSQRLFARLGFLETRRVEVFREVHFELDEGRCAEAWAALRAQGTALRIGEYDQRRTEHQGR